MYKDKEKKRTYGVGGSAPERSTRLPELLDPPLLRHPLLPDVGSAGLLAQVLTVD